MRRILFILILLFVLGAGLAAGIGYLNRAVLPVKTRQWVKQALSDALGRPVTVESVQVHLWHGFIAKGISIPEDPAFGQKPLLEIDQLSGGVLFFPILRQRQIIIPALRIEHPRLSLVKNADGLWNFSTLKRKRKTESGKPRLGLLISRIILSDGKVEITFPTEEGTRTEKLRSLGIDAHLRLPAEVKWTASADLEGFLPTPMTLQGEYHARERRWQAQSHSVWAVPMVLSYLPKQIQSETGSMKGILSVDLNAEADAQGPIRLRTWMETDGFGWEKSGPQSLSADGEWQATWEADLPSLPAPDPFQHLKGKIHLDGMTIRSAQRVPGLRPGTLELEVVRGDLLVDSKGIRTEQLTAQLPFGVPLVFSGSILNDKTRSFGCKINSALSADQLASLPIPDVQKMLASTPLSGQVRLEAIGSGSFRPAFSLQPSALIAFEGLSGKLPNGWPLRETQGQLRWQPDLLTFSNITGELSGQPMGLEGTMVHFDEPEIDARFSWGGLSAETQINFTSEKIGIDQLSGTFPGGTFRVLGEILRPEQKANLLLESQFRLEESALLWPPLLDWVKKNKARGEISARCLLEGNLSKLPETRLELKLFSPQLVIQELLLHSVAADLLRGDDALQLRNLQARWADGTVTVKGTFPLGPEKKPWAARGGLSEVQLSRLAEIFHWKETDLSGLIFGEWEGTGQAGDLNSIQGEGRILVSGARILELPWLGRFADLIGAATLRTLAFQEAQGKFQIREGEIQTENFQLTAPQASITLMGSGGFLQGLDSPIRWHLVPTFAPELIPEEARSRIGKVLAQGTSYFFGEVRITGTWKEPKTKFVPKPITQILNEQFFNLQDLLGDLF